MGFVKGMALTTDKGRKKYEVSIYAGGSACM